MRFLYINRYRVHIISEYGIVLIFMMPIPNTIHSQENFVYNFR